MRAMPNRNFRIGSGAGCRRQVDDTAGLHSAPEMPCAPGQLRLVPTPDIALAACRRSVIRRGPQACHRRQRGRYAELGSVRLLKDELEACGAKSKSWTSAPSRLRRKRTVLSEVSELQKGGGRAAWPSSRPDAMLF